MTAARTRTFLLYIAVMLGAVAPFAGEPARGRVLESPRPTGERPTSQESPRAPFDARALAAQVEREEDHITARELASWIRARKPGLRIVDLRTPQQAEASRMPAAKRLTIGEAVATAWSSDDSIVLVSAGGAHSAQAWVLLRASGHEKVWFLRGGYGEWTKYLATDAEARAYFGSATPQDEEMPGC